MKVLRTVIILSLGAAAIAGGVLASRPKPVIVEAVLVERGTLEVSLREEGKTRVREHEVITSPVAGVLVRPEVHVGDLIQEGQVIAQLAPLPSPLLDAAGKKELLAAVQVAEAAVRQARANVEAAKATLDAAKLSLERQEKLAASGSITPAELEAARERAHTAEHAAEAAAFGKQVAEQQASLARASLKRAEGGGEGTLLDIRSNFEGRVLSVFQESGGPIAAGTPLLEVGDLSTLEVIVPLLTREAASVPVGTSALIRWPGGQSQGYVRMIEPKAFTKISTLGVEEQRVNVVLALHSLPKEATLGEGFSVEVSLLLSQKRDVVRAPTGAVFRRKDSYFVFVVDGDKAKEREILVGQRGQGFVEILNGLDAGEQVLLYPPDTVSDGTLISLRESS